jgi:iron complex outermembrane receptor protein
MSLEDLSNIRVSSVSKHEERIADAPAAIFVITGEDIRRSGVTSIPEALRLAPGMEVARLDSHNWAVSSRGFNDLYANKLLVVMDGRSVYTPLFSGVFWDVQDTMLEDIDRIEVIRGPGATLWGANAVNGVVNIITKAAKETQGGLITGGAGTQEQGFGSVRYGGKLGEEAFYRVYAKYFNRDDSILPNGDPNNDGWQMWQSGFRTDWEPSDQNVFTLQGDAYYGEENQTFLLHTPTPGLAPLSTKGYLRGGNAIGRWTHCFSAESELQLQAYYDHTTRDLGWFNEDRDTADVELQYRVPLGNRQSIVAGTGYRYSDSYNLKSNFTLSFFPPDRETHIYNAFVQDEITLVEDRLRLTLGSKFEYNDYTHWEIQPSGRLLWTPHENHSFWASVSRAVRTPSRVDNDSRVTTAVNPAGTPPFFTPVTAVATFDGNSQFESEVLMAYELGYRVQPHHQLSLDLALFYNDYDRLRSFEPGASDLSAFPAYIRIPLFFGNGLRGETYGGELTANFQITDWWHWRASYSYLQIQLHTNPGSGDTTQELIEGASPHHQVSVRSLMDLPWNLQFDTTIRYVDALPTPGLVPTRIGSYVGLDLRLGWKPFKNLDISIVGQNLLDNRHPEFPPGAILTPTAEIERAVYAKATFKF